MTFFVIIFLMSIFAVWLVARPLAATSDDRQGRFARVPQLSVIMAVLLGVGLYSLIGRPDVAVAAKGSQLSGMTAQRIPSAASGRKIDSVATLLGGLEDRLKDNPNDAGGWLLLARSYQHLGKTDEARDAYARAVALGKTDPGLDSSLADDAATERGTVEIRGRVSIAAAAADEIQPTDTVFVLAKAVGGSPMPLAVLRRSATDLPFEFTLNDELSMVRGNVLSSVDAVIVSAKISRSGNALQSEPGFAVTTDPVATREAPFLELEISPANDAPGT
jgi:hypothetical protein